MRTSLILFSLIFCFATFGQSAIDYNLELQKNQQIVDLEIVKLVNKAHDDSNMTIREIVKAYNDADPIKSGDRILGAYRHLLYSQFIEHRHSSVEFSTSILNYQVRMFSAHTSVLQGQEMKGESPAQSRVDPLRYFLNLSDRVANIITKENLEEASFPKQYYPRAPVKHLKQSYLDSKLFIYCKANYFFDLSTCSTFLNLFKVLNPVKQSTDANSYGFTGVLSLPHQLKQLPRLEIVDPVYDVMRTIVEIVLNRGLRDTDETSIYDLFINKFVEYGASYNKAREMTFSIMGLYGQRGASFASTGHFLNQKLASQESYRVLNFNTINLSIIFSALSVIDKYTFKKDKTHFSLPSGFKSSFLIGKPYYFWMSSTLVNEYLLHYKKLNKRSLVRAIQLLNKIYQLKATFNDRNPNVFSHKYANLSKKQDMVASLSGAIWRINNTVVDMDKALYSFMLNSESDLPDFRKRSQTGMSPNEFFKHSRLWHKVFDPSALFEEIFTQGDI